MSRLVSNFKNMKFQKKILLFFLLVSLIPLIFTTVYFYNETIEKQRQQLKKGFSSTADQISLVINEMFSKHEMIITYISVNSSLNKVLSYPNMEYIEVTKNMNDVIEPNLYYYLLSPNMYIEDIKIYSNLREKEVGSFIMPESKFEDRQAYEEFKSSKMKWYFEGDKLFLYKKIVNEKYGKDIGFLIAQINYKKLFEDMIEEGNEQIRIYNKDKLIFSSANEEEEEKNKTTIKNKLDKIDCDFYFIVSERELYESSNDTLKFSLIIVVFISFVVIIVSYYFSKSITQPIEELIKNMSEVEKGNFNIRIKNNRKDEIGILTDKFKDLTREIDQLIHKVYKSELKEKETRILALRAQINPHFLYNILSMINWKAKYAGISEISEIVKHISSYYRTSFNQGKEDIKIKDEVDNIRSYMDLKNMLLEDKFEYNINLPKDIEDINILTFILQPIVENSIIHGFSDIDRKGIIEIDIVKEKILENISNNKAETDDYEYRINRKEYIVFKIKDNGKGISKPENILKIKNQGYGLRNVNERIKIRFGDDYGISIESLEGKGTTVYVKIGILEYFD